MTHAFKTVCGLALGSSHLLMLRRVGTPYIGGSKSSYNRFFSLNIQVFPFLFCSIVEVFTLVLDHPFGPFDPDFKGSCARFLSNFDENVAHGPFDGLQVRDPRSDRFFLR
jgi:hypothetical protein